MDTAFLIAIVDLNYLKDENRWLQKFANSFPKILFNKKLSESAQNLKK